MEKISKQYTKLGPFYDQQAVEPGVAVAFVSLAPAAPAPPQVIKTRVGPGFSLSYVALGPNVRWVHPNGKVKFISDTLTASDEGMWPEV